MPADHTADETFVPQMVQTTLGPIALAGGIDQC